MITCSPRMTGQRLEEGSKLQECCRRGSKSPRLSKKGKHCLYERDQVSHRLTRDQSFSRKREKKRMPVESTSCLIT